MICNVFLLLLAFLGVFMVLKGYSQKINETFLSPGEYPSSVNNILLDSPRTPFQKKKNIRLTEKNAEHVFALYPKTTLSSYDQITNNQKTPITVCNGKAVPASFCGAFYNPRKQEKTLLRRPCENRRVNFYNY
tara:strand:+ start:133 stop:531 length:399 start_codon:yes stop_codon:yes gene_type:complete